MARNIRKVVSIICAVSLLLSLCAVSFFGASSAMHLEAVESDNSALSWNGTTVLDLTFEGTNSGGIAMSNATSKGVNNGVLEMSNTTSHNGSAWFAKDATVNAGAEIPSITDRTIENTLKANLFEMKANTSYKITFKYAFRKDTPVGIAVTLMAAVDPYLSANHGRDKSLASVATIVTDDVIETDSTEEGNTSYNDWKEVSIIFTTSATLNNKYLGFKFSAAYMKFDYITIEEGNVSNVIDYTEVYDWTTDGATPSYWDPNNNNFLSDSDKTNNDYTKGSFVDAEGLHFSFSHKNDPVFNKGWIKKATVKKDSVGPTDNTGTLVFKADRNYIITVKYKPELIPEGKEAYIGIGYGHLQQEMGTIEYATHTEATDEWQYLTTVLKGDRVANGNNCLNLTAGCLSSAGRCSFLVESVTVRTVNTSIIVYDTAYGELDSNYDFIHAGNKLTSTPRPKNVPEGRGFAGWYCGDEIVNSQWVVPEGVVNLTAKFSNTISSVVFDNQGEKTVDNLAVGLELPNPTRPNSYLFFEGWYTDADFTNKITTVPDYDVTVYAKYNGTYLNFNNIAHVEGEAPSTVTIETDPADKTNKVVKFTAPHNNRRNFMIPVYDIAGSKAFELKTNTSYVVSFKVKLVNNNMAQAECNLYQGDYSQKDESVATRTAIKGVGKSVTSTNWTTVTCSFITGDTLYLERVKWSYQNHLLFTLYSNVGATGVYIDDFMIAESIKEAPEGAIGISFEANTTKIPTLYGFPGESLPSLVTPTLSGHQFVGWYADKNLTVPFKDKFFGNKDITLYAKWAVDPFLVDFSNYQQGVVSARAKFLKDDKGNDYLDWWVKYATTNTSDKGTPYRVYINKDDVHFTCEKGQQYTFTFKYKLLDSEDNNITIQGVTSGKLNGWVSWAICPEKLVIDKPTDEWTTASLTFTATPEDSDGVYLSLGIAGHGHILIDDVQVSSTVSRANLYGKTAIFFNANDGESVDPISGDPGEPITKLPTTTKKDYAFNGWYIDKELTTPFQAKTWGKEDLVLYASWIVAKFSESYENFPKLALANGVAGAYSLYKSGDAEFNKANVHDGSTSLFRKGDQKGSKAFTLCRDEGVQLTEGRQYTLTFYVKPTNVTDAAGTISLIGMKSNTGIALPLSTNVITTVGDLKSDKWQKVTYTFTADSKYVGISTTAGNDMYLDNFTIAIKDYVGTTTGDSSANPFIITLLIVLAAGSLVITGKKVFEK